MLTRTKKIMIDDRPLQINFTIHAHGYGYPVELDTYKAITLDGKAMQLSKLDDEFIVYHINRWIDENIHELLSESEERRMIGEEIDIDVDDYN